MSNVPEGTIWFPWNYVKTWTTAEGVEQWDYSNTLQFRFNALDLQATLDENCGGDKNLSFRLAKLLQRRIDRHCIAVQYADDVTRTYRRMEIVPFPVAKYGKRIDWDDQKVRHRSMLSVRWLMRWLLDQRREYDPQLGSSVRTGLRRKI